MYKAFYGLTDNPFSIAPNPNYLFLSDRHREALVHLTYGLGDTGGFVLLTGEVGTGKTTVSRCILRQLPENTDTAFILNPSLTELELLATLCDELKISYGDEPTLKQLTDLISNYLLANHKAERNTVLIIDEAQHLRAEVLEQLRLLTNLETDTRKLLQVILIGQPELQQLLKRQELRQLAQRITARYHLLPLTLEEVGMYVQHRLQVAGRTEPLFNAQAIKALHQYSGGVPRLINLLCERALMGGYGQSKAPIDRKVIQLAAQEVIGNVPQSRNYWLPATAAFVLLAAFAGGYFYFSHDNTTGSAVPHIKETPPATIQQEVIKKVKPVTIQATEKPVTASNLTQAAAPDKPAEITNVLLAQAIKKSGNIDTAFAALFALWDSAPYNGISACQSAEKIGLSCSQQQGDLNTILRLNYPAVVYFKSSDQPLFYGALVAVKKDQLLLQFGEQQFWTSKAWFNQYFDGTFELLWKLPATSIADISTNSSLSEVQWLENTLAKIEQRPARDLSFFDAELEQNVKQFQQQNGLTANGVAGQATIRQLNLYMDHKGPQLQVRGNR